jgi:hypothetical protein
MKDVLNLSVCCSGISIPSQKKNQNVDDWPSWPTTNSNNTRIFLRFYYKELIRNLPFHVRMQILTRHHLLWVMADIVRGPGCGSCSLVAVSLQFISGWQEVVARTRFDVEVNGRQATHYARGGHYYWVGRKFQVFDYTVTPPKMDTFLSQWKNGMIKCFGYCFKMFD